jgi:AAA15 family ATPase/GTPase
MIIQLNIKNYKSFKDDTTLSLVASNYDKETREEENIALNEKFKLRLLKSAVVYGANAGGKSKFIEALIFMREFILTSSKDSQKGELISVEPFRLNSESIKKGSEFEVSFIYRNELYRYGFEVNNEKIIAEWLYHKPKTKEIELFYRDYQNIVFHATKLTKANVLIKEKLVRDNALFLSVLAQFNDKTAETVLEWFKDLKTISGLKEEGYLDETMQMTKDAAQKERILAFLRNADIGIDDFKLKKHVFEDIDASKMNVADDLKMALEGLGSYIKRVSKENKDEQFSDVITFHKQFDDNGEYTSDIQFSLKEDESSGTRKFFALIGQILKAIDKGSVLFVDELDSKLHPNLVGKIVSLFNSKKLNPNNAQLIFNTHDTNLLSSGLFRRDQIWFTQKDKYSAAKLYSLSDFKTDEVRKNEAFEDNYIRGKYGAIPFLGDFEDVIQNLVPINEDAG